MRVLITCALAAVLLATTLGTMSTAQAGGSGPIQHIFAGSNWGPSPQWQQGGGLPYGDYQQTCRNIRNNGYRLEATCQKRNGDWRSTSLYYRDCRSSIVNDNGRLRCSNGGEGDHWRGRVPSGPYEQTCRNIRVDGNQLNATCQKRNGDWRNTSLSNFNYCRSQIENENGHLRCR